jgi:class 3 adenylate cyclase/tetratricopeptide (TPR) repeat protein
MKFCGGCGAPLDLRCPACKQPNPTGFRFCGACGSPLSAEPAAPSPASPSLEGERRQLSVMFVDLVGSTSISGQFDPEDLRAVLRAYQEACAGVIERYEGHVGRYMGDGLLVYFGYPQAHEDDAQRAVKAGLGMVEAVGEVAERFRPQGIEVALRAGIHTGLVVVGEMGAGERVEKADVVGETPNISARLQSLAEANEVLLSGQTERLVRGYFELEGPRLRQLKGVGQEVAVYRVLRETGALTRLDLAEPSSLTPLAGRRREVALLQECWEKASRGQQQVVLLSGEPGIGKSRLVHELQQGLGTQPHNQMALRCAPYHQISALFPVSHYFERLFHEQGFFDQASKLAMLEELSAQLGLDGSEAVPLLAGLLSLDSAARSYPPLQLSAEQRRQRTLQTLLQVVKAQAQREPLLLVVEDLHWADPSTLEFLSLVIEAEPGSPVMVVLTFRPDIVPPWSLQSHFTPVTLTRLSPAEVMDMARTVATVATLPAGSLEELARKTDGIPLFVEELTKSVAEAAASGSGGTPGTPSIPATLVDSLVGRLDRLGEAKAVAQAASVLGREFSYELLAAVSAGGGEDLDRALGELVAADLLYQRGTPPHATYIFKHALIQDAAHASLLISRRQQQHLRAAEALERLGQAAQARPEVIAGHYAEAGLLERAVYFWQIAAQRALERSENEEAIGILRRALDSLPALPDTRGRAEMELSLLMALAYPLVAVGWYDSPELEPVYQRARVLCVELADDANLMRVMLGLGNVHVFRGQLDDARELSAFALGLAEQSGDRSDRLNAHSCLGFIYLNLGDFDTARQHAEAAISLYDREADGPLAWRLIWDRGVASLADYAEVLQHLGFPEQSLAATRRANDLATDLAHPVSQAIALTRAIHNHFIRREMELAQNSAGELASFSSEHRLEPYRERSTFYFRLAAAPGGNDEDVVWLQSLPTSGSGMAMAGFWMQATALLGTGLFEEALHMATAGLAEARARGSRLSEAELERVRGQALLGLSPDNAAAAEASFQAAIEIARAQSARHWELRASVSLARLWQKQGRLREAVDLLRPIYGWFNEGFGTPDLLDARALLEELEREAGGPSARTAG